MFGPLLQLVEKIVALGRGVEAGRTEAIEINVPLAQGQQLALPNVGNRTFLGHKGAGSELKGNRPELGIVDPIAPFAQIPDAPGHKDRGRGEAEIDHQAAQFANARIRRLRTLRILAVGDSIMAAGEPGILIHDPAEPPTESMIGALPQCPERTARGYDRIVVYPVARTDLGNLVRHSGTARDAVNKSLRPFEHPV